MFPDEEPTEQEKADFNSFIETIQKDSGIPPEYFKPDFPHPMLVSEIPGHRGRISEQEYVFIQPKLEGHCCMANTRTRKIYTRTGNEITTLPHINAALPLSGPEWLHGELWKPGANCDDVAKMVKRGNTSLEFHVFDCVADDGFGRRTVSLITTIVYCEIVKRVPTYQASPEQIEDFYTRFLSDGYEGLIIRLDGHGYYHGRSINVFKMKPGTEGI